MESGTLSKPPVSISMDQLMSILRIEVIITIIVIAAAILLPVGVKMFSERLEKNLKEKGKESRNDDPDRK